MTYRFVNRMLLVVGVLMAIAIVIVHHAGIGGCAWRFFTGRECLLCGCTRDFYRMIGLNFDFCNPLSPIFFIGLIIELGLRCVGSFVLFGSKMVAADLIVHGVTMSCFTIANLIVLFS